MRFAKCPHLVFFVTFANFVWNINSKFSIMKTFRKMLLVALVALFSFGYASADFRFGVKAGLNVNKLDISNPVVSLQNTNNHTGWQAGVMAEFTIPIINLGADVAVMYARQNISQASETLLYSNKDFIDLPINLKWKIGLPVVGKIISPIIYTGPDFLFALNKETLKDVKSNTCEVGWNLGIGLELLRHLQITGGYCFGISNIAEKTVDSLGGVNLTGDMKAKKNYWTISAAYLF